MSAMYAQAVMQGMDTLNLLAGGDNAGTIAAYNEAYSAEASRYAAQDALHTAEQNISAIEQDKILTNVNIEMNQAQAKAQEQVNAAAAGVSGGSVDAVMYGIDANASMQKQQNEARADQLTEQQLANVSSASMGMSSALNAVPQSSTTDAIIGSVGQIAGSMSSDDWTVMESLWSN